MQFSERVCFLLSFVLFTHLVGANSSQILQDQVSGKRNLWLSVHNDPKEHAAALDTVARSTTATVVSSNSPQKESYLALPEPPGSAHSLRRPASFSQAAELHRGPQSAPRFRINSQPQTGFVVPALHRMSSTTAVSSRSGLSHPIPHRYSAASSSSRLSHNSNGPKRTLRATAMGSPVERHRDLPTSIVRENLQGEDLEWAESFQTVFALIYGYCLHFFSSAPKFDGD